MAHSERHGQHRPPQSPSAPIATHLEPWGWGGYSLTVGHALVMCQEERRLASRAAFSMSPPPKTSPPMLRRYSDVRPTRLYESRECSGNGLNGRERSDSVAPLRCSPWRLLPSSASVSRSRPSSSCALSCSGAETQLLTTGTSKHARDGSEGGALALEPPSHSAPLSFGSRFATVCCRARCTPRRTRSLRVNGCRGRGLSAESQLA